jgi:ribonuclease HI
MDASFSASEHNGAVGAVLQDSNGMLLRGLAWWKTSFQSALIAEAEACRAGLQILEDMTDVKVILVMDSKVLVDLWTEQDFDRSEIATIPADIGELASHFSSFSIVFVKCYANWAAHLCAQEAARHRIRFEWDLRPNFCCRVLCS